MVDVYASGGGTRPVQHRWAAPPVETRGCPWRDNDGDRLSNAARMNADQFIFNQWRNRVEIIWPFEALSNRGRVDWLVGDTNTPVS